MWYVPRVQNDSREGHEVTGLGQIQFSDEWAIKVVKGSFHCARWGGNLYL